MYGNPYSVGFSIYYYLPTVIIISVKRKIALSWSVSFRFRKWNSHYNTGFFRAALPCVYYLTWHLGTSNINMTVMRAVMR